MAVQRKRVAKKATKKQWGKKAMKTLKTTAQLAADVAKLGVSVGIIASRLNVEKKYQDVDVITSSVGQVYGTTAGYAALDVTPQIGQGTARGNRIGGSIKLTGMSFPIQFSSQGNCGGSRKLKVMLLRVNAANNTVSPGDAINDYLDPNPLNGLRDMGSPKAYRSGKHDGIHLVRSKVYALKAPTLNSMGNDDAVDQQELSGFTCKFNVKLNDVLRYDQDGHTAPDGTRYYLYIFCDRGNNSYTVAGTADVPITAIGTGVDYRMAQRSWWVDN